MKAMFRAAVSASAISVACISSAGSATAQTTPSSNTAAEIAQDRQDSTGNAPATESDIVVTGSRAVRDGSQAPTPVTVLGEVEIQRQAPKDLTDVVNQIPSIAGSMTPQSRSLQSSNGTVGLSSPALRGLGSNRTLVLIDGQRSVSATQTGEVDIGSIPQGMVKRVDVVTGGASSAYGSDALAGVVNFVLDTDFTGVKTEMSGGMTDYGDDQNYLLTATAGFKFAQDRAHVVISGEQTSTTGAFGDASGDAPSRKWIYGAPGILINPGYIATNGQPQYIVRPDYALANASVGGLITSGPLRGTAFNRSGQPYQFNFGLVGSGGGYMSGGDWQKSDVTNFEALSPKQSRQNVLGRISYDVTDRINIYAQAAYSHSDSVATHSTFVAQGNVVLRGDNAFLPASVRAQAAALGVTSFNFGYVQPGPRNGGAVDRRVQRYVLGTNGSFDALGKEWEWKAYYQRGQTRSFDQVLNNRRQANLTRAYDAVVNPATGTIVCRSTLTDPNNGCRPLNVFGFQLPDDATRDYVYGTSSRVQFFKQDVFAGEMRGEPLSTWAGPVSLAFGIEHRRESANGTVDALSLANGWGQSNFVALNGKNNVTEGFAEVQLPLVKNASWTRSLEVNGAVRGTNYSTSGYVTTWKGGMIWSPIEDVRFRVTRSRDIRAPTLSELFTRGLNAFLSLTDPANGNVAQQVLVQTVGNTNLKPEKADTFGAGIIVQPTFLPGFTASADYYHIRISDAIGTVAGQDIVNQCAAGVAIFCPSIARQNGVLSVVTNQPFNFANQKASGVDFEAAYRRQLGGSIGGTLAFRFFGTLSLKNILDNGITPPLDLVGEMRPRVNTPSIGGVPNFKYQISVNYDREIFNVNFIGRGVSSGIVNGTYIECSAACPTATVNHPTIDNNHVDGAVYFDASVTLKPQLSFHPEIFFSVRNLANKDGAYVFRGPGALSYGERPTQETVYDLLGRTFRVGVRFRY